MSHFMGLFGKFLRSTTFVVLVVVLAIGAGTGAYLYSRSKVPSKSGSAHVSAAPSATISSAGLQVIMGSPDLTASDASATTDASAATGAAAGAAGADGLDGAAGADGANGADGAAGADGATGPEGPQGPKGSIGATGPAGSIGATGPAGSVGATGPAGAGLTAVSHDGGGFEFQSPDGVSYRIHVTNTGIYFEGPTTTEVWSDTSHFQTLVP
ncbi:MAG: hypothetical protein P4L93_01375 [Coriobacteriia bacterium]|nr:hypothetical protein [Coriobacteriia bacterium]